MLKTDEMIYLDLLEASDAQTFLKHALDVRYKKRGKVNVADFSRRAGFSSRSFLSEYLAGRKGLSRESLSQIRTALKLPKPYLEIFSLLAAKSQPELLNPKLSGEEIEAKILATKNSIIRRNEALSQIKDPQRFISKPMLFRVFASLGAVDEGASLSEVAARAKLTPDVAQEMLQILIQEGAATFKDDRYYAPSHQIDFPKISSPASMVDLTRTMCSQIRTEAHEIALDPRNFVFYTAFSIPSHQLAEFKDKLREAIFGVLDQYQDDRGDCVHEVFLCAKS
ncbi:MAG: hypothetical protein OM95_00875 [Bdellovibrio sp. ArHS]|uniref:hypothetical protein n=1 Tax=Bdellovibrio sp. ArHS TaxID=1569284 RepID=UPI000582B53A|nr:hypothetical protein [Bdellovibrio sp. ArHS]KHD89665.1 MAG: hypothetical protein OM95_00875 [Bdellovibrio sp. ArHS]